MRKKRELSGINIQYPISRLIVTGEKTIETRTYAIPKKYVGIPMALIETPGKNAEFKARIIAIIQFGNSFEYPSAAKFYADFDKHRVDRKSIWRWNNEVKKHGWPVTVLEKLQVPIPAPDKKGIVFTTRCLA